MKKFKRKLRELAYKHAPRKVKEKRAAKVAAQLRTMFNTCPPTYIENQPN